MIATTESCIFSISIRSEYNSHSSTHFIEKANNTVKLRKSGQYQKMLESKGRDFQYFLVLATFEEFGCCKPHSIYYLMPGSKIYDTQSPNSVTSLFTGIQYINSPKMVTERKCPILISKFAHISQ